MTFLITFIILSFINVVFSTVRSITTIKSGKVIASLISGGYFAFYNVMLIYTVSAFPLWQKCIITFICNVVGVFITKAIEEKLRQAKLWKVELTVYNKYTESMCEELEKYHIPYNYIPSIGKYTLFNAYCETENDSKFVKAIANRHKAKYFVIESKTL